jgi:magnesium transporter
MNYPSVLKSLKKPFSQAAITYNPSKPIERKDPEKISIYVFDYNATHLEEKGVESAHQCMAFRDSDSTTWLNVDGLKKEDVETICKGYGVHPLIQEDILSMGQRPKMDEIDDIVYVLMNMLYYNEKNCSIEQEQISIVLGKNFVLSFQEDAVRDVLNPVRDKLKQANSRLRQASTDFLFYSMLDLIVDNYFTVMEKLSERIEEVEDEVSHKATAKTMNAINALRKEMITLKRNLNPVRDMVNNLLRSESTLMGKPVRKYFKDVYDHIVLATELAENYRDMVMGMQDLYLNQVNLKMNEVMKFLAIVTALMAPATVIGGIFGMNFDVIPLAHQKGGFYTAVVAMLAIPVLMLFIFWRRGWFTKSVEED